MDLSYILNSPDVERVATALESISGQTVSVLTGKVDKQQGNGNAGKSLIVGNDGLLVPGDAVVPSAVATALLACFRKVAWVDTSGEALYEALQAALNLRPEVYFSWRTQDGSPLDRGCTLPTPASTTATMTENGFSITANAVAACCIAVPDAYSGKPTQYNYEYDIEIRDFGTLTVWTGILLPCYDNDNREAGNGIVLHNDGIYSNGTLIEARTFSIGTTYTLAQRGHDLYIDGQKVLTDTMHTASAGANLFSGVGANSQGAQILVKGIRVTA